MMELQDFRRYMGQLIRQARKRKGLSLHRAAREIGFNAHTTLYSVERGHTTPPWARLDRFEEVLGFRRGFLLTLLVNWKRGVPPDPQIFPVWGSYGPDSLSGGAPLLPGEADGIPSVAAAALDAPGGHRPVPRHETTRILHLRDGCECPDPHEPGHT